jgi:hypothetical protein
MDEIKKQRLIKTLHKAGLHNDGVLHVECEACVSEAFVSYLDECIQVLWMLGEEDKLEAFDKWLNTDRNVLTLHEEPVYMIAMFLGISKLGKDLEQDPRFQRIERVAAPLRQERLGLA